MFMNLKKEYDVEFSYNVTIDFYKLSDNKLLKLNLNLRYHIISFQEPSEIGLVGGMLES